MKILNIFKKITLLILLFLLFAPKICFADVYSTGIPSLNDLDILDKINLVLEASLVLIAVIAASKIVMANFMDMDDVSYKFIKETSGTILFYACLFYQSFFYITQGLAIGNIFSFFILFLPTIIATALRILEEEKKISFWIMIISTFYTVFVAFFIMGN